jgi:2-iminobutanoate/2-iminopropanoate deaminase
MAGCLTANSSLDIICANSEHLAPPAGHYSHVCIAGGMVHISGQLPMSPEGAPLVDRPFVDQATQALANLEKCLAKAGVGKERLVQVRVYITDIALWSAFNRIYAGWIGDHRPARAVVPVPTLHYDLLIEIEASALAREP